MAPVTLVVLVLAVATAPSISQAEVTLSHLDTMYLPYAYDPETYGFDQGGAEKGAVDTVNNFIYTIGQCWFLYVFHYLSFVFSMYT